MGAQANLAPVIIKRKKVIKGGGHHGGAWKVAISMFLQSMTLCVYDVRPPSGVERKAVLTSACVLNNAAPPDLGCRRNMHHQTLTIAENTQALSSAFD